MKLKYKVKKVGDDVVVSLDTHELKITPKMFEDIEQFNFKDSRKLAIDATKAELHWRLTNKNMGLHDFARYMRHTLGDALWFEDQKLARERIKNALRYMNNYLEDEFGVY